MSSQLGNEYMAGAKPDNEHASCSDLGVDVFLAGFLLGYVVRARQSHKRRAHYLMYARYGSPKSPTKQKSPTTQSDVPDAGRPSTAFGHARRAF